MTQEFARSIRWVRAGFVAGAMLVAAMAAPAQTSADNATASPPVALQATQAASEPAATALPVVADTPSVQVPKAPVFSGADTAWMLISTVLVLMMTMPGIILFYSGMLRTKNALSIVAHTVAATAVITLAWAILGYSLAFTTGSEWVGGLNRIFSEGLIGKTVGAHAIAPTIPESAFFLF
ncbi:MAG TPA: ammonia channel protein, partial [Albitalea sp.]|nr:ammonia channel protein [Albitalea sp.]